MLLKEIQTNLKSSTTNKKNEVEGSGNDECTIPDVNHVGFERL